MKTARLTYEGGSLAAPENMIFDVTAIFERGEYEVPGIGFVKPPRVLDIGSNVGAFALWAAIRWPGATVDCYEPNPAALAYLERNAQPHMTVHPVAVVGAKGPSRITLRTGAVFLGCTGRDLLPDAPENLGGVSFDVDAVRSSDLPHAEMVKIDTEGCEVEILEGYDLSQTHVVMLEWHRREDRKLVEALLEGQGFTLWSQTQRAPWLGTSRWVREEREHA